MGRSLRQGGEGRPGKRGLRQASHELGGWPEISGSLQPEASFLPLGSLEEMELGEEEDRQSETWVMYLLCDLKEVPALSGPQISHLSMGVFLTLYLMNKGGLWPPYGRSRLTTLIRTRLCPGHHRWCLVTAPILRLSSPLD